MATDAFSRLEGEILAHASWVRRLARSLVASEADAEDVVQETWVAALRRPPGQGAPARPWLARVVRNLAARRWRRNGISLDAPAEPVSARGEDPLDSLERLETQRILVEELQALPEPARRVILLRYFDGLDAAEIAVRTGEPHGTVRWRLHEALAVLRARLDRRHDGGRKTWMRALTFGAPALPLPFAPQASPHIAPHASSAPLVPTSIALSTGVLAVNTFVKIAVAALVVLALSVGVYVATQDAEVEPGVAAPAGLPDAPSPSQSPKTPDETQLAGLAGTAGRAEIDPAIRPAAEEPSPGPARRGVLVARCIDEQVRPLPGAWLSWDLSVAEDASSASQFVARAGPDGQLRLDTPAPAGGGWVRFVAGCEGFATRWLSVQVVPDDTTYAGDLVLGPGGSVSGRVIDERGRSVEGAEIRITEVGESRGAGDLDLMRVRGPQSESGAPSGHSDRDGRFHVAGVPVGPARVWARADGTRWSVSAPVEVRVREETRDVELALELDAPDSTKFGPIEGIVLAPDETPVKSPVISVSFSEGHTSSSTEMRGGADGRFKIIPMGRGPHDLSFSDPESATTPVRLPDVAPGTRDLVVRLSQGKPVAIAVRAQGQPVTEFELAWREVGGARTHGASGTATHADGRAVLVAPGTDFTFTIDAGGYLPRTMGPYDGRQPPAEIEVVLDPVPGVHGRVLAAGQPVPGARVWLRAFARHMLVQLNEFDLWVEPTERCLTTSDAEGRFRLGLQEDGEFMVFAEADGWAQSELGPLELVASVGQKGLELVLDAGGAIEGHVRMPPGRDPAGTIVSVNHGEGRPRTQTVGPDGRFRFEKLTPGGWKVARSRAAFAGPTSTAISSGDDVLGGSIDTNCIVVSGQTSRFDLDLRDEGPCVLELVLRLDGEPAKAWTATLWPEGIMAITHELPRGATDAQGRARIEGEGPGSYELRLVPAAEDAANLEVRVQVDLGRGTTPFARDLKTGRLEGTLASWQEGSEHGWRFESDAGADFIASGTIRADADGRFVLPIVPVGPGRILRDVSTEPHSADYEVVASFTVEAGKTSTVSVP